MIDNKKEWDWPSTSEGPVPEEAYDGFVPKSEDDLKKSYGDSYDQFIKGDLNKDFDESD